MLTTLLEDEITEITPTRNLNLLYIILDCIFLVVLLALLIWQKRYQTVLFALFGGILYTIVDYGGFYLISQTRTVFLYGEVASPLNTFWVLLWMSMSYGITNFVFIWTCLNKDKLAKYWIFLIVVWWLICPSISELGGETFITTQRTTGAYHGWMGVVMIVSYLILAIILIWKKKKPFTSILFLFAVGFFVQFGWEFSLLINGIRPMNSMSLQTLIVNSCLETNLGMPAAYLIWWLVRRWRNEDMSKVLRPLPSAGASMPASAPAQGAAPDAAELGAAELESAAEGATLETAGPETAAVAAEAAPAEAADAVAAPAAKSWWERFKQSFKESRED